TCLRRFVLEPGLAETLAAGAAATVVPTMAGQLDQLEEIYRLVAGDVGRNVAGDVGRNVPGAVRNVPGDRGHGPRAAAEASAPRPSAARGATAGVPEIGPVLFLAGADGAPFRYRVTHVRDALTARGVPSRALWWSDPDVPRAIAAARVVVV